MSVQHSLPTLNNNFKSSVNQVWIKQHNWHLMISIISMKLLADNNSACNMLFAFCFTLQPDLKTEQDIIKKSENQ